jgi:hypothetical protein
MRNFIDGPPINFLLDSCGAKCVDFYGYDLLRGLLWQPEEFAQKACGALRKGGFAADEEMSLILLDLALGIPDGHRTSHLPVFQLVE